MRRGPLDSTTHIFKDFKRGNGAALFGVNAFGVNAFGVNKDLPYRSRINLRERTRCW